MLKSQLDHWAVCFFGGTGVAVLLVACSGRLKTCSQSTTVTAPPVQFVLIKIKNLFSTTT
jgi:hypothetical protein